MRVETTRVANPVRLQHMAGFYDSMPDLVGQALPLVSAAFARAEPVALAVRPTTERALHDVAGGAAGFVTLESAATARGSGQTMATRRARQLRELTTAGAVTVLIEHDHELDGVDGRYWTELDAAQSIALGDLPVSLVCFFPQFPLHLEILDGARRNHPQLLVAGERRCNPAHRSPRDVLAVIPASTPLLLGPPEVTLTYTAWQLHDVRCAVEQVLADVPTFVATRIEDVVLAVNEVATNAVEHGGHQARLALWVDDDELVCEVHDIGTLVEPLPGMRAPHPSQPRGRGLWIARQLCDVLHIWWDAQGTHVRLHAGP